MWIRKEYDLKVLINGVTSFRANSGRLVNTFLYVRMIMAVLASQL